MEFVQERGKEGEWVPSRGGVVSVLEHHGGLQERPGLLYSAVVLLVSIKFRFVLGYSGVVLGVVVGGVQRLRRRGGRGRVFESVLNSLPPLGLKLQRLL